MTFMREAWKNIVACVPPETLETIINYSVIRHTAELRRPPRMLSDVKKHEYFREISEYLGSDQPILFLEFGVHKGSSIRRWRELNSHEDSRFVGFDSFVGLPHRWRGRPEGYFDVQGATPQIDDDRVSFVKGWFNDTLPAWLSENLSDLIATRRLVIHLDADLYHSGLFILTELHHAVPEYALMLDNYSGGEARALRDYLRAYGATFDAINGRKRRRVSAIPGQVFGIIKGPSASNAKLEASAQ